MSRRKQRFPFHLTGDECESSEAGKEAVNLNSPKLPTVTSPLHQNKQTMDAREDNVHETLTDEANVNVEECNFHTYSHKSNSRNASPSPSNEPDSIPKRHSPIPSSPAKDEVSNICKNETVKSNGQTVSEEIVSSDNSSLKCPVCQLKLDTMISFNSHVYDHYQKSTLSGRRKRAGQEEQYNSAKRPRTADDLPSNIRVSRDCHSDPETYLPLDLSCHRIGIQGEEIPVDASNYKISLPKSPETCIENYRKISVEEENIVNEAREHEKSFFNTDNELYLTEDSSEFESSPLLPVYQFGGDTRQVKVCGDEGSPMVYKIKLHSEQMLVSRILGVNQETGNKIELYKCFLCGLSFPSISRLHAHLLYHKQKFNCKMCNYSCDTRGLFAHHVQKQHLVKCESRSHNSDLNEDSGSAENTVTVAALLSALRKKKADQCGRLEISPNTYVEMEDDGKSESISPISPSSESQESLENRDHNAESYKGYSCRFCNKRFDRAFSCNRHERVHTGYKPCYCHYCGRGFSEPRNLRHHIIRFHSDGSLRHLIKRDRRRRGGEDFCGTSVSPIPLLKNALQGSSEADVSNFVNNIESYNVNLNSSFDNVQDQKPLGIDENMAFRQNSLSNYTKNLTKMLSLETKTKNRKADGAVRNGDSFRTHSENNNELEPGEIRFKIGTKVIEDGDRGRRLVMSEDNSEDVMDHSPQFSSYAPRLHIVQDRINREKALTPITDDIGRSFYECPYCRKLFGSTSDLNRHLDFHEDLRPYDCDYCNYSARTNSQLKVHKMRHEGIKQYTCDVCNYNGVTQSDLNRHKKTQSHTARSQNICTVCGLGFYSHSQKQVHIVQCHPEMEGASSLIQMSLGVPLASKESPSDSGPSPTKIIPN